MKTRNVCRPLWGWNNSAQSCSRLSKLNIPVKPTKEVAPAQLELPYSTVGNNSPLQYTYLNPVNNRSLLVNSAELVKYRREIIEKYADVTSIRIAGECIKRKIPFDTDLLQQYTFQVMAIVVHKVRRTGNPHPISVTDLIEQTIKQFLDLLATLQRK